MVKAAKTGLNDDDHVCGSGLFLVMKRQALPFTFFSACTNNFHAGEMA
jgi:hypothetical protein